MFRGRCYLGLTAWMIGVLLIQSAGAAGSGLIGWWTFDGDTKDSSGLGNDGTAFGDPTFIDGVVGSGALDFDGDDYVTMDGITDDFINDDVTMSAWIKTTTTGEGDFFSNNAVSEQFLLCILSGDILFYEGGWKPAAGVTVNDDAWHHVAATRENMEVKIYVDGVYYSAADFTSVTTFAEGDRWSIAQEWDGSTPSDFYTGSVDDVLVYNRALSSTEILDILHGRAPGTTVELAGNPTPGDLAYDVVRDGVLSWTPGMFAGTHNVYLGESFEDVNAATVPLSSGLDVNSFDPERFEFGKTYYWRVDEVNGTPDRTVFKGAVWQFTAEPYSIQIPGSAITVTASSMTNEFSTPSQTVDGSGLGADGTHAISPETMWFTAAVDLDPWIQYEFDDVKKLDIMKVWNSNSSAEMAIGWGVKDVQIEYSLDGENWDVLADANQFSRATGLPTYSQYDEIDFGGAAARMVRLNIQSNWGGILMSYGLSEVQFSMIPAAAREPVPASEAVGVSADAVLMWRAGREAAQHTIYLGTDANAVAEGSVPAVTSSTNSLDLSSLDLDLGATYYWRVDEVNEAETTSVWAGPVWSFSTVAAVTVDDFERYSNISPNRPFQTWLDGFGYSADEFFPAGYGGNGTGAGIGHDIWSLSSPHYDGDIMEGTFAKSGQSMPLYYDNTAGAGSETQRTLDPPQDWTAHGIKSLSLSFRGEAGNTGQLYVKINGAKVTYSGVSNALETSAWLSMIVDLSTVTTDLSAVTSLAIGIDGAGAQGVVYLDDLMLYPLTATMIEPVAPSDDDPDLVGLWKLDDGAGTTAADASGNNRHGVLTNGPFWTVDGVMGGALECDGVDDYVVLDTITYGDASSSDFSVALWVKTTGWDSDAAMISNKDWNSGGNAGWVIAGGAGNNGSWQWNYSDGSIRADFDPSVAAAPIAGGEWVHLCVTHDRDGLASFYHDGQLIGEVDISDIGGSLDADFPTVLGTDGSEAAVWAYWFTGAFDDVRIYNRVLSAGEILGLNGVTDPVAQPF